MSLTFTRDAIRELGKRALTHSPFIADHQDKHGNTVEQCKWCGFESYITDDDKDRHRINCLWVEAHQQWQREANG